MLGMHVGLLVKPDGHRFSGQRACPVTDTARSSRKRVTEIFGHHGGSHLHGAHAFLGGFELFECIGWADLGAGHAQDTGLSSRSDSRSTQVFEPCFQSVQTDALVGAHVGALAAGDTVL